MADSNLRLVSLTVLGGALDGRRHNPEEVVTEILVGADPDCHLVVDLPGVSPIHARVWADLDQSIVYDTHAPSGLYVNTTRVEGQAPVGEGDVLWLGPPQQPDSVCVQFQFAPWVEVLPEGPYVEAEPSAPASDDDPFFVGEASAHGFPGPSDLPAGEPSAEDTVVVEPAVEEEPAAAIASHPRPGSVPADPPPPEMLTPEALVAETIADDWAFSESPSMASAPTAAVPLDDFFVAEEPLAQAVDEAVFVDAEALPAESPRSSPVPAFELPPLPAVAVPHPERAPLPPQKAVVLPEPPAPLRPPRSRRRRRSLPRR